MCEGEKAQQDRRSGVKGGTYRSVDVFGFGGLSIGAVVGRMVCGSGVVREEVEGVAEGWFGSVRKGC